MILSRAYRMGNMFLLKEQFCFSGKNNKDKKPFFGKK
jgi:hypothetical protein